MTAGGTAAAAACQPGAAGRPVHPASGVRSTGAGHPASGRPAAATAADWTTYHYSASRAGVYPRAVPPTGRLIAGWKVTLDGAVYAEPLVLGGTVIVATEHDTVYGIRNGAVVWRRHLGTPVPRSSLPCGNIDPLGITGTPVYNAGTGLVYVVTRTASPTVSERHTLVAVDPRTGARRGSRVIDPAGSQPHFQQQRGALTIADGRIWVPFGGLAGDCGPYHGYLVGSAPSLTGGLTTYQTQSDREGAIWTPPGATVDPAGHLYVSVGNGSATQRPWDGSDSVLELSAAAKVIDYFAPSRWDIDNANDRDLGSQGPALVGNYVFIAGKSGTAYTLRSGALGHIGGQASSSNLCTSFGGTAVSGSTVYVPCTDGVRAVSVGSSGAMQTRWHTSLSVNGSPVSGGGALFVVDSANSELAELDAATGQVRAQVSIGSVSRFATPALTPRYVVVGTVSGVEVFRFG